jgi:serine/threonine protein kinase
MSRDISQDLLGRLIGSYELVDVVGSGPHGTVFRARDLKALEETEAWRALKVMLGPIADLTAFKFRLPQEMRTAVQLAHPNIVPVYQFGSDEGRQYVAMEFVDSTSLDVHLRRLPLTVRLTDPTVQRSLREVARALDFAHAQRVVHGNIKPSNVLLRAPGGQSLLTDFCLARAVTVERIAEAGLAIDCAFRSPEQCSAAPPELTPASDLYSFAALLWYVAAGAPPYGTGMEARAGHVGGALPELREVAPHVPAGLGAVLARGLSTSPDKRYPRADQLVRDFLAAVTAPARPAAPPPRPAPPPPAPEPPPPVPVVPPPVAPVAPFEPAAAPPVPAPPGPAPGSPWVPPVAAVTAPPPPPPSPAPRPAPPPPVAPRRMFVPSTAPVELRYAPEWRPFPSDAQEVSKPRSPFRLSTWQIAAGGAGLLVVIVGSLLYLGSLRQNSTAGSNARTGAPPAATLAPTRPPSTTAPTAAPTAAPPPPTTAPLNGPLPPPVTGSVGAPVRVNGLQLTVENATANVQGGHPTPPVPAADRFYVIDVLYENTTGRPVFVSPFDWSLTDQNGQVYGATQPGLPNDLTDRQLPSGGESRGLIGFAVPASATGLIVHYAAETGDAEAAVPVQIG